jgi:3-hydroxyisobutyrate dehydrogenase-like beta-hydroxyacid dehydrogenase
MNQPLAKPLIAFLGIGLMGAPMAKRLHAAGYPLCIWNRTTAKTLSLQELGITAADTPQRAVRDADIIITMLENGAIVKHVLGEAVSAIATTALVIDMSSTSQSESLDVHRLLNAAHIACLDAPVSGGVLGAEAGTLAIMAGGAAATFARAAAIFAVLGRATHVGGPGAGQVAKLCNQLIVGGTLNIVAEALLLAQAAGADPVAVRQALRGGFAESRILEVHGQRMLERNFMPGGQVKSQAKDMENILQAAATAGLHLPMAQSVRDCFASILDAVPQADQSAVLLAVEQGNPGRRLGTAANQLPAG